MVDENENMIRIMRIQYIVRVMFMILLSKEVRAQYAVSYVRNAVNHIEAYNGIKMRNVVLLTSSSYEIDYNEFTASLPTFTGALSKSWDIFVHQITMSQNSSNIAQFFQTEFLPSTVIILQLEILDILSNFLDEITLSHMRNNWLIISSGENKTTKYLRKITGNINMSFYKYSHKCLLSC